MTIGYLKASRRLWARRLKYRNARLEAARRSHDPARIAKWEDLVADAKGNVRRRDAQISANQRHGRARRVSEHGAALIAGFEGGQARDGLFHPYRDAVGVWTIGYGHTAGVGPSSRPLTKQQALELLRSDLDHHYAPPVLALKVPLTQNQLDALVSFTYNLGAGPLGAGHSMGDALRRRDYHAIAEAFLLYDQAGGRVLPGLAARRRAERALFLKG